MKRALVLALLMIAALAAKRYIGADGAAAFDAVTGREVPAATREVASTPAPAAGARSGTFRSGEVVTGAGIVTRLLPDDTEGSRHQRFILRLPSGQTVLVAHNIDLAPRIPGLRVGDGVEFRGEYETNAQGGVVHWTHRDPRGAHAPGWLRHRDQTYQ